MKTNLWHEEIRKSILSLGKMRDDFIEWDDGFQILEKIKDQFSHLDINLSVGHAQKGQLHGLLMHIHDLKAKCDYDDLITHMESLGFKKQTTEDYAEIQRHTTSFRLNKIPVKVSGFFVGGSCEFVQVGTESKPIYELKCTNSEAKQ